MTHGPFAAVPDGADAHGRGDVVGEAGEGRTRRREAVVGAAVRTLDVVARDEERVAVRVGRAPADRRGAVTDLHPHVGRHGRRDRRAAVAVRDRLAHVEPAVGDDLAAQRRRSVDAGEELRLEGARRSASDTRRGRRPRPPTPSAPPSRCRRTRSTTGRRSRRSRWARSRGCGSPAPRCRPRWRRSSRSWRGRRAGWWPRRRSRCSPASSHGNSSLPAASRSTGTGSCWPVTSSPLPAAATKRTPAVLARAMAWLSATELVARPHDACSTRRFTPWLFAASAQSIALTASATPPVAQLNPGSQKSWKSIRSGMIDTAARRR